MPFLLFTFLFLLASIIPKSYTSNHLYVNSIILSTFFFFFFFFILLSTYHAYICCFSYLVRQGSAHFIATFVISQNMHIHERNSGKLVSAYLFISLLIQLAISWYTYIYTTSDNIFLRFASTRNDSS